MKRHGGLFEQAFTREGLHQGFLDARRSKRSKRGCFEFERRLGSSLAALHDELHSDRYSPSPYFRFEVHEPKRRVISAPAFRDCVVQHAIYRLVYPIFNQTFVHESFACRVGKGTHAASDHVQNALRRSPGTSYVLKLDVRRFFYSIDRGALGALLERKVKDQRFLRTMMQFAADGSETGIPLGNLLSQLYALVYLSPVDHFIKREIKVRHYARYVDDMVLIGLSRQECLDYRRRIERFLAERLGLALSKSSISQVRRGVNFVGYRTWKGKRFVRKHSLYKFRRAVRGDRLQSVISLLGHARHTQSMQYMLNLIKDQNHALYRSLPESHRRLHHAQAR